MIAVKKTYYLSMPENQESLSSKVVSFLLKWIFLAIVFGGILLFAAISLFPIFAHIAGWTTVEITTPGEGDCNPNWTSADAC